ncbi:MAG: succinate dehydrogenase, hydrophobic membrane anchor protein [Steroidobacteraceae bacterium]
MSLRTPLRRVLNHGSARDGVSHWWVQRVTAVALAPLCVWLVLSLLDLPTRNYAAVTGWIGLGLHPVLLALTVLLSAWHGWLGLQIVIEDYVPRNGQRVLLLLLSTFVNALLAACGIYAVLRIAFTGAA